MRRTHEFVDMVSKISADKGVLFDFTNNEKLKKSGFAKDGRVVNGYVTKDGITLNLSSAKALNSVVGHEITHVLEGTELYGEIKYLYKLATAGSKEARELEEVKHKFEQAYKESAKAISDTKYSLSETTDGRFVAVVDSDILSNIDTSSWDDTKKAEAKKAASDALKKFNDGIVVNGITRKVNKVSRREYTRSNYTESLYKNDPDVFADKMRAADVVDDIVVAATNWSRDGGLTHERKDNFVDFDHGQTLIMSGNAKYSAEVVVGITDQGDAVFYDVVDMKPTIFDIKKAESSTTVTTQNAIDDIQEDSSEDIISQNSEKSRGEAKNPTENPISKDANEETSFSLSRNAEMMDNVEEYNRNHLA